MLLLLFDHPYPSYLGTANTTSVPFPVNCVMGIIGEDDAPDVKPAMKFTKAQLKRIFRE